MADPRVIPGDDGAGPTDQVGPGAPAARIGQRDLTAGTAPRER